MSWNISYYQRNKSDDEKFWEKVDVQGDMDCWEWMATRNKKGYGNFYISLGHSKDKHILAHRRAYMLSHKLSSIPNGMCVLHKCDNPSCCNPNHLFLGTNYENVLDKIKKGRMQHMEGESVPTHKLKTEDIYRIRKLREEGKTYFEIADIFHIHYSTVGYIIRGKLWKHLQST